MGDFYTSDAFCFTLVPDATFKEVLAAYGGSLTSPSATQAEELLFWELWQAPHVVLIQVEGAVVAVESNQWEGVRPEVMRRLSEGRRVAGLYRNVNGVSRLALYDDGDEFFLDEFLNVDDLPPHLESYLLDIDIDAEQVEGAPYESSGWFIARIAAMERFTGRSFDGTAPPAGTRVFQITEQPHDPLPTSDVSVVDTPRELLRAPAYRQGTAVFGVDRFAALVDTVRAATPDQRRRLSAWSAWWACETVGLSPDDPGVQESLDPLAMELATLGLDVAVEAARATDVEYPYVHHAFDDDEEQAYLLLRCASWPDTGKTALETVCGAAAIRAAQGPGVEDWLGTGIAAALTSGPGTSSSPHGAGLAFRSPPTVPVVNPDVAPDAPAPVRRIIEDFYVCFGSLNIGPRYSGVSWGARGDLGLSLDPSPDDGPWLEIHMDPEAAYLEVDTYTGDVQITVETHATAPPRLEGGGRALTGRIREVREVLWFSSPTTDSFEIAYEPAFVGPLFVRVAHLGRDQILVQLWPDVLVGPPRPAVEREVAVAAAVTAATEEMQVNHKLAVQTRTYDPDSDVGPGTWGEFGRHPDGNLYRRSPDIPGHRGEPALPS
ncbi:MAG: DUF6461 domain-containing protein [Lapillicoccus sp.]